MVQLGEEKMDYDIIYVYHIYISIFHWMTKLYTFVFLLLDVFVTTEPASVVFSFFFVYSLSLLFLYNYYISLHSILIDSEIKKLTYYVFTLPQVEILPQDFTCSDNLREQSLFVTASRGRLLLNSGSFFILALL